MEEKRLIDADDLLIAFGNALNNATLKIGYVFIMLVQLLAFFRGRESVSITKIVWDKLDRLKDNLDKEAAKQEGRKDDTPEC